MDLTLLHTAVHSDHHVCTASPMKCFEFSELREIVATVSLGQRFFGMCQGHERDWDGVVTVLAYGMTGKPVRTPRGQKFSDKAYNGA
jgi:hypothetical protein